MRPRLAVILLVLLVSPLALLAWIGARGAREEREAVARRLRELIEGRLLEIGARIEEVLGRREREIERGADGLALEPEALRRWLRALPCASQVFLLGPDGKLLHPAPQNALSDSEVEFLRRAEQLFREADRFFREPEAAPPAARQMSRPAANGWYAWYWGSDVQLARWQRLSSGHVLGVELNRARFIADLIAALPSDDALPPELRVDRVRLADSKGETLFAWGDHEPGDRDRPSGDVPLRPPLAAWRLQYFPADPSPEETLSRQKRWQLLISLATLGVALAGLGVYFWRESSRALREARQRVSFVNQVSHELKTPLTNIRMYADLLQERLADDGGPGGDPRKSREYLEIIAAESGRLGRLIGNVLAFASREREALRLHRRPGCVDETVAAAIERFRPALATRGVEPRFTAGAPGTVRFDPDALEQILDNLLGNVEKYAPGSGAVEVSTRRDGAITTIVVADRGPGIPESHREEVFEPFRRLSDQLTEGVSGTGLGLTIARDLARRSGGDVRLVPAAKGACFEVTIETPATSAGEGEEAA